MLPDKLKQWSYYKDKLPLYIKKDAGICGMLETMVDLLPVLDNVEEQAFNCFDIMNDDYYNVYVKPWNDANKTYALFDLLGKMYGITSRKMVLSLQVQKTDGSITFEKINVQLTDYLFWLLLKARIIQRNYKGTYKESKEYYKKAGIDIMLQTNYATSDEFGSCTLWYDISKYKNKSFYENLDYLVRSGLLTLQSEGIEYVIKQIDVSKFGKWAVEEQSKTADVTFGSAYFR